MIVTEFVGTREDGVNLYRRYSDHAVMLLQVETGVMYEDPVDIETAPYTYEETDVPVGSEEYEEHCDPDDISPREFMALVEEAL